MKYFIKRLIKEENGQGMTEYGMMIGFVAVVAIVVMIMFRQEIRDLFTDVTTEIDEKNFDPE